MSLSGGGVDTIGARGRIPFAARLRAWWEGYDLRIRAGTAREQPPGHDVHYQPDTPDWQKPRIDLVQQLWGQGFVSPGDAEYLEALLKPFGLTSAMSVLDVGAGLGGCGRLIAGRFGAWVTGLEPDEELAAAAAGLSEAAGMGRRAEVRHATIDPPALRPHGYDCIFAKEAFYRVTNRKALIKALAQALKPRGQLLFTDYLLDRSVVDERRLGDWLAGERLGAPPWSLADYQDALAHFGLEVRVQEDITADHRTSILRSWAKFLPKIREIGSSGPLATALVDEVELWTRRVAMIDGGLLKVYRFYARAGDDDQGSGW